MKTPDRQIEPPTDEEKRDAVEEAFLEPDGPTAQVIFKDAKPVMQAPESECAS